MIFLLVTLVVICAWLVVRMRHYRRKLGHALNQYPGKIPQIPLEAFHQRFVDDDLGATLRAEVAFIGCTEGTVASVSDREAWILAVLAKDSPQIFEFGTASGRTTYLLARNQPENGQVVTLTLSPEALSEYQSGLHDNAVAEDTALKESAFSRFRYTDTDVEPRIEQLYGDSKRFEDGPHAGRYDLIFIDGGHAESYVHSDTEKALRMVRPGGVLIWHDYRYSNQKATLGVCAVLDRLAHRLPLSRLANTSFVVFRQPAR